jgi:hypothetical protein
MSAAADLAVAGNLPTPAVVTQPDTGTSGAPADPAAGTIQLVRPDQADHRFGVIPGQGSQ